jgi:hypothetical protein
MSRLPLAAFHVLALILMWVGIYATTSTLFWLGFGLWVPTFSMSCVRWWAER